MFAHLQPAKFAGEADDTHIVSGLAFDSHNVALGDLQPVGQAVEVLMIVLETHLDTVEGTVGGLADACHPVGRRDLGAAAVFAAADGLVAFGLVVATAAEKDGLFVFHPRDFGVGLEVGVQLTLLAVVLLHFGVLALYVLLLLMGLATVFHEVGQVLGSGHGFLFVDDDIGRQFQLFGLRDNCFLGDYFIFFTLFFHCCFLLVWLAIIALN